MLLCSFRNCTLIVTHHPMDPKSGFPLHPKLFRYSSCMYHFFTYTFFPTIVQAR